MALPTANTPGYGSITRNGRTYVGCDCTIAFLLAGERYGLAAGRLKEGLDIVQLTGNAAASGGVHRLGAAFDVKQYDSWWTRVWREMGAAFWPRLDPNPGIPGDLWDGNEHGHAGIDCPHNSLISYQNVAYRRGYNGLGQGWYNGSYLWGYGAKDNTFRPAVRRSWKQGIAWADAETAKLKAAQAGSKPAPTPAPVKDDIMAMTAAERAALVKEIAEATRDAVLWAPTFPGQTGTLGSSSVRNNIGIGAASAQATFAIVTEMAKKSGVDIDEKALAAELVAGLAPAMHAAVQEAVAELPAGTPPAELADMIVKKIGQGLTGA